MPEPSLTPALRRPLAASLGLAVVITSAIIAFLFAKSFKPELVLFSNDAPLGLISAQSGRDASTFSGLFSGYWQDLNWIGIEPAPVFPNLSFGIYMFLRDPVLNAKYYPPISLIFLGISAWLFFRQLGFRNAVCILGGLAAALNMNTFSHTCWGLPSRALAQAAIFLGLAALQSATVGRFWFKALLGGFAVGMAVMEGFDVGALYSLYVAAFAFFLGMQRPGSTGKKLPKSVLLVAVVALSAGWIAAHGMSALIGTQIKGIAGTKQDDMTREQRWDFATWWSLPPLETLRVVIPGVFGYRMDTGEGGRYWGRVGEQPGLPRHSGAGEYAGILVVVVAGWALATAFRKKGAFTDLEKRHIYFWGGAMVISVLLAWGRHAPFYHLIYALPYFSTIRNPIKFMHMFHLSLLILFAFGLEGLYRLYIAQASTAAEGLTAHFKKWHKSAAVFDKRIVMGGIGLVLLSALGFLIYYSSSRDLAEHLRKAGIAEQEIPLVSSFTYKEVLLYLLFLVLSVGAVLAIISGWFAGQRWKIATLLLGGILVVDLARANQPWIVYYDYKDRYANGPLFEELSKKAYEHRVTSKLFPFSGNYLVASREFGWFASLCNSWLQNQFQFYNITSLEVIQLPRVPELDMAFIQNFTPASNEQIYLAPRMWELTSTRLLLAQREYADFLNQQTMGGTNAFQVAKPFTVAPKSAHAGQAAFSEDEIVTQFSPDGPFAIVEFTNALPRVKVFTSWETVSDDKKILEELKAPNFNPSSKVFVSGETASRRDATNATAKAEFIKYAPKEFSVKTESDAEGILMVTDKYTPNWKVWVDGKEQPLLRVNYIMRGVQLPAGNHQVEFKYRPPIGSLYVTLSAMGIGLLVCGFLAFTSRLPKASPGK